MNGLRWRELGKSMYFTVWKKKFDLSLNKTAEKLVTHFNIAKNSNGRDVG